MRIVCGIMMIIGMPVTIFGMNQSDHIIDMTNIMAQKQKHTDGATTALLSDDELKNNDSSSSIKNLEEFLTRVGKFNDKQVMQLKKIISPETQQYVEKILTQDATETDQQQTYNKVWGYLGRYLSRTLYMTDQSLGMWRMLTSMMFLLPVSTPLAVLYGNT